MTPNVKKARTSKRRTDLVWALCLFGGIFFVAALPASLSAFVAMHFFAVGSDSAVNWAIVGGIVIGRPLAKAWLNYMARKPEN